MPFEQLLFLELTANQQRLFLTRTPLANPDELIGRRGLRIYKEMRHDDQVKAALSLKKHAVLSTGWDIEAASDDPRDQAVADFVKWNFEEGMDGSLDDDLLEILSALVFGFSVTEKVFAPVLEGDWVGKIKLRKLATRQPDDFTFAVDPHDNLLPKGIEQFGKSYPREKFVLYSYQKEFDNWYGLSDLRAAYRPYWFKDNVLKWWSMFLDRYGIPLAIGRYDAQTPFFQDSNVTDLQGILDNLQAATAITLPKGFELDFPAPASAQGSSIFAAAVQSADLAIARALLLPNLLGVSAQGDVGSYSQARKQFDVFILLVEKLQRDLSEIVLGEQVIKPLVRLNFDVEAMPTFTFLPFTESNKAELPGMFNQAIAAGAVKPRPEDEVHVRSVTEFPEIPLEDLQAEAEAEKAGAAGAGGAPPFGGGPEGGGFPPGGGEEPGMPAGAVEELSDEELDALIEEALGGGGKPTEEEPETFARRTPKEKETSPSEEEPPEGDADDAGAPEGAERDELSEAELDALIDEVLGGDADDTGGEADAVQDGEDADEAAEEEVTEEGDDEAGVPSAAGDDTKGVLPDPGDEAVALAIRAEHPEWDDAQVQEAVQTWRTAREQGSPGEEAARAAAAEEVDAGPEESLPPAEAGAPEDLEEPEPEDGAALEATVREEHPDWDDAAVAAEVARRRKPESPAEEEK